MSTRFKRPRLGGYGTYEAEIGVTPNGTPGILMWTIDTETTRRIGGWLEDCDQMERIRTLLRDENTVVVVRCFWFRRFVWRWSTCWNGDCSWSAYDKGLFGTEEITVIEFDEADSDSDELED